MKLAPLFSIVLLCVMQSVSLAQSVPVAPNVPAPTAPAPTVQTPAKKAKKPVLTAEEKAEREKKRAALKAEIADLHEQSLTASQTARRAYGDEGDRLMKKADDIKAEIKVKEQQLKQL